MPGEANTRGLKVICRTCSPRERPSTLITAAPRSASRRVACGPETTHVRSQTRTPVSGSFVEVMTFSRSRYGHGREGGRFLGVSPLATLPVCDHDPCAFVNRHVDHSALVGNRGRAGGDPLGEAAPHFAIVLDLFAGGCKRLVARRD